MRSAHSVSTRSKKESNSYCLRLPQRCQQAHARVSLRSLHHNTQRLLMQISWALAKVAPILSWSRIRTRIVPSLVALGQEPVRLVLSRYDRIGRSKSRFITIIRAQQPNQWHNLRPPTDSTNQDFHPLKTPTFLKARDGSKNTADSSAISPAAIKLKMKRANQCLNSRSISWTAIGISAEGESVHHEVMRAIDRPQRIKLLALRVEDRYWQHLLWDRSQ